MKKQLQSTAKNLPKVYAINLLFIAILYGISKAATFFLDKQKAIAEAINLDFSQQSKEQLLQATTQAKSFLIAIIIIYFIAIIITIAAWLVTQSNVYNLLTKKTSLKAFLKINSIWLPTWLIIAVILGFVGNRATLALTIPIFIGIFLHFTNILYLKQPIKQGLKLRKFLFPYAIIAVLFVILSKIPFTIQIISSAVYTLAFSWAQTYLATVILRKS